MSKKIERDLEKLLLLLKIAQECPVTVLNKVLFYE